jgi:malate permease and related proteins
VSPESLAAFAFILLMLAIGKLTAWRGWLPDSASDALNWVVLNLCLPAAVLLHVPKLSIDAQVPAVAAVPWILFGLSALLVLAVSRLLRWSREVRAVLLVLVPLGNTSFLGFPLVRALLGGEALPYAVIYDQFGSFLMMTTVGLFLIAWYSGGERPTLREIGRRILLFPPFIALLVALFMPAEYPVAVSFGLERLADALLPLVVLALGMKLQFRLSREFLVPLTFGLTAKLLLLPALALLFAPWLGLSDLALQASVLESGMPPMITAAALLAAARLAPELATAMAGYGIVAALGTLALWTWWIA